MLTSSGQRAGILELAEGYVSGTPDDVPVYERPEDFESFYRRELPALLVLGRVLAGPALADEVAQETMLVGYRRWDEVRCRRSPAAWIRALCMQQALSALRRRRREERLLRLLGSFRGWAELPHVRRTDPWHVVRDLPEPQAEAVAAHYGLGLPARDVAEVLGCPEEDVLHEIAAAQQVLAVGSAGDPAALDRELRSAGELSRDSVTRYVDVETDLEELQLAKLRRRRVRFIGLALAALVVAAFGPLVPGDAGVGTVPVEELPVSPVTPVHPGHAGFWRSDWVDR